MVNKQERRGMIKLRKGIIGNLHPSLSFLDKEDIPFEGWFDLDQRFFYIEYGTINRGRYERGIMTPYVENIVHDIRDWQQEQKGK